MAEQDDQIRKLAELIDDFPIAMLATHDGVEAIVAQPFAMQQQHHAFDGELWFLVSVDSSTAARISQNPAVTVVLSSNASWLSVAGTAELTQESSYIDAMWDASIEAWFPGGRDDPGIGALIFHADSAEYWDTSGGAVATALSFVTSKVTGNPMEIDSDKIDV